MIVLITGINGFVGQHLSKYLISKGYNVYGIDKSSIGRKHIYKCDILDYDNVSKIISKIKPYILFHLAGFSSVKLSFDNPELCRKINVEGTKNIFESIINHSLSTKILVVTSADIYGIPKKVPIEESFELNPTSPYGKSRKLQEELCEEYKEKLQIIISRSFPHIGPGQTDTFVTSIFAKQIAEIEKGKIKPILKVGNLNAKRDFTDVRDIAKAYVLAVENCNEGIFNICSGNSYSIKEILDKLLSMSSEDIKIEADQERMRPSDIPNLQGNNAKFFKATKWSPEISLNDSLKDILNYWRKIV